MYYLAPTAWYDAPCHSIQSALQSRLKKATMHIIARFLRIGDSSLEIMSAKALQADYIAGLWISIVSLQQGVLARFPGY